METQKGNRAIAEFMGVPALNWNPSHTERNYHNDWRMLMGVIEKLESEYFLNVQISKSCCYMSWLGAEPEDEHLLSILKAFDGIYIDDNRITKLSATYAAVIAFIKWHKNNTKL